MAAKRTYGLFERRRGTRKWHRVKGTEGLAFPLDSARRIFQSALLAPFFGECDPDLERSLRPATREEGQ